MDETINRNGVRVERNTDSSYTTSTGDEDIVMCSEENYETLFEDNVAYATSTPNPETYSEFAGGCDGVENKDGHEDTTQPRNDVHDPYLEEQICQCTTTTRGEAMMMCLALGMRHSLTWVAICDMLKMIHTLTTQDAVPTTKYNLMKYFPVEECSFKYHLYCPSCEKYMGKTSRLQHEREISCPTCGLTFKSNDMTSFFLTLNFGSQLAKLLANPEVRNSLNERFHRKKKNRDALEDIYDGNVYKKLSAPGEILSYEWNLSYTFNTDGCQSANSSKVTIWPIYIMINELPHNMRAKHMLLAGVWVAKNEPNMNLFLQPFVNEANELSNVGLTWKLSDSVMVTSKVIPICCCVDSIARPAMLNMKQFNGFYGCTFCEHPTESVAGQRKYTVSKEIPPARTDDSIKRDMILAHSRGPRKQDVNGVWGPSCLMNLKHFDLVDGMVPDDLHAALLGCAKQHTDIVLTSVDKEYYIGDPNRLGIVDQRLLSIKPPNCITRTPRSLTERRMWEASEWRSWLILYSLICMDGVLPTKYLEHFALLVTAINMLLQDSITTEMLNYADRLLIQYVVQFQEFCQKQAMTFNIHLLLHLTKSVANWGPLWTHTAFPFENENRLLLQLKKSPTHIALQIARKFVMYKSLSTSAGAKFRINASVKTFCKELTQNRVKFYDKVREVLLIGSGKLHILSAQEQRLIGGNGTNCRSYEKRVYNKIRYTVESYQRCSKTNNAVVVTESGMGIIHSIYKLSVNSNIKVLLLIRKIETSPNSYFQSSFVNVSHIKQCRVNSEVTHAIAPSCLNGPGILFDIGNKYFVSKIPRGCLKD